jgi:hypothetical protein
MRGRYGVLVAALLAGPAAAAEINVRVAGGRVDLTANAAPVADVLDRLSRQTGMKVVYEGAPPRQLVSVTLAGRTPAEAVVGLLEGLGLNYMLLGDPSGARVQTLMMGGAAPTAPSPRIASPSPSSRPAPVSSADADEAEEPDEEPEPAQPNPPPLRPGPAGLPPPAQGGPAAPAPNVPGAALPGVTAPSVPSGFTVSPFPAGPLVPRPVVLPTPQPGNVPPAAPAPGAEQKPDAPPS